MIWARKSFSLALAAAAALACAAPARADVIVQVEPGTPGRALLAGVGATHVRAIPLIGAFAADLPPGAAAALAREPGVRAVSPDARVRSEGSPVDTSRLSTAYDMSVGTDHLWNNNLTGAGVGVAVVDTGIAGGLPDFRVSASDPTSRVIASAVTNPDATTAGDAYGHGTHVAGIIAGDGNSRGSGDPLRGRYVGIAPDANLISIKADDDDGATTVLDVINGIQFAVDHKADYNIRVLNLSLESATPESYKTDPLDAAVEAAWLHGIVVVAAAGNRGTDGDAVTYAPGNDPFVISVGAVDDKGTKSQSDDAPASWGSAGTTQDGLAKPDVVAPGAHIVSALAPGSAFAGLCPSCVRDGEYIQAGGTSMSAPVVSGIAALLLQKHPDWTPNQVKGALVKTARPLSGGRVQYKEIVADKALGANTTANAGLVPNAIVDPATGAIDYTRATWSRATWSSAADLLRATWSRATWSCACGGTTGGTVDPTRATWSRATWSTSWSK
jgi:serine protease AprX